MEHDHLLEMLNRLKLTAIRDQVDSLIDEAARRELSIREALSLFCEREIARKDERRIEMNFPFVQRERLFLAPYIPMVRQTRGAVATRAVRRSRLGLGESE